MTVRIALADAIKSGVFGPVRFGMTKSEVKRALGEPDDWIVPASRQKESPGWKYGDIEIFFAPPDWTVDCVFADYFDVLDGGARLHVESGRVRGGMGLTEVIRMLEDLGVPVSEVPAPSAHERWLRTGSGVTFHVVLEPEELGTGAGGLVALWWKASYQRVAAGRHQDRPRSLRRTPALPAQTAPLLATIRSGGG